MDAKGWGAIGKKHQELESSSKDVVAPDSLAAPELSIDQIETEWQPRGHFDKQELQELADSIRQGGILQPITVNLHPTKPNKYVVHMGERRFRAAQIAGLKKVPVSLRTVIDDFDKVAEQLVENILRAKLDPLEVALGLRAMQTKKPDVSSRALAKAIGKDVKYVSAHLNLLTGPEELTKLLEDRVCTDIDCADHLRKIFALDAGKGQAFVDQYRSDNPPSRQDLREAHRALKRQAEGEVKNPFVASASDIKKRQKRPIEKAAIRVKYSRGEFSGEGQMLLDLADNQSKMAWVITDDNEELRVPLAQLKVISVT